MAPIVDKAHILSLKSPDHGDPRVRGGHQKALSKLFGSGARVRVLRVFMLDPRRAYYQRQVEAATGLVIRSVQRELERLTAAGLLFRHEEGNRCYYQVNTRFPFFPELRSIFLRTATPEDVLRARLCELETVRLALLHPATQRVLVVADEKEAPTCALPEGYRLDRVSRADFVQQLFESPEALTPFLREGLDLLGRRDDIVWRHIESAGYEVKRLEGVV